MVYFHKKGITTTSVIASLVLILAFSLISFVFLGNTLNKSKDLTPYLTDCKIALAVDRYTEDLPILGDRIKASCATQKLYDLNDFKTPKYKREFIAKSIARSFNVALEGKDNLWDDDSSWFHTYGYTCIVLFDLDYNDPVVSNTISIDELNDYMLTENYDVKGMTYNKYIQQNGKGAYIFLDDLVPGDDYAVAVVNPYTDMFGGSLLGGDFDDKNTVLVFGKLKTILEEQLLKCIYIGGKT